MAHGQLDSGPVNRQRTDPGICLPTLDEGGRFGAKPATFTVLQCVSCSGPPVFLRYSESDLLQRASPNVVDERGFWTRQTWNLLQLLPADSSEVRLFRRAVQQRYTCNHSRYAPREILQLSGSQLTILTRCEAAVHLFRLNAIDHLTVNRDEKTATLSRRLKPTVSSCLLDIAVVEYIAAHSH